VQTIALNISVLCTSTILTITLQLSIFRHAVANNSGAAHRDIDRKISRMWS